MPRSSHRLRASLTRAAAILPLAAIASIATAERLPDTRARELLSALKSRDAAPARRALREVQASGDERFTAPLIELLRADSLGIVATLDRRRIAETLESSSGQPLGDSWSAWVSWYAESDLVPPPGFTGWKGQLLSRIDSRFGALLANGVPSRVRVEEVVWGGVPYEGIPALDEPAMIAADRATYLRPDDAVFGIAVGEDARAYPLRILDWHEMANDRIGGIPVSLAYCTLCGSGIAYDGRGPDGQSYDFGSSGLLMRSNKLMVDRQTNTLWDQLTGRPVIGPLVDAAEFRLRVLPSVVTTWRDWRKRHPGTRVLSLETGHARRYEPGAAYADYFADAGTMFPVPPTPRLAPKTRVFGLEHDGEARAWEVGKLTRARLVHDRVGGLDVVLVAPRPVVEIEGRSVRTGIRRRYRAGASVRAYAAGRQRFVSVGVDASELSDEQGGTWKLTEDALVAADGRRLHRVAGVQAYWFAWSLHHPNTSLYEAAR